MLEFMGLIIIPNPTKLFIFRHAKNLFHLMRFAAFGTNEVSSGLRLH